MPLGREVWPDAALLHKHPPERAFQSDQLLPRRGQLVPKLAPPGSSVHLADRAGEEAAEAVLDRTALRVLKLKEREVLLRLLLDDEAKDRWAASAPAPSGKTLRLARTSASWAGAI